MTLCLGELRAEDYVIGISVIEILLVELLLFHILMLCYLFSRLWVMLCFWALCYF